MVLHGGLRGLTDIYDRPACTYVWAGSDSEVFEYGVSHVYKVWSL